MSPTTTETHSQIAYLARVLKTPTIARTFPEGGFQAADLWVEGSQRREGVGQGSENQPDPPGQ